jgi:dolichol kinase
MQGKSRNVPWGVALFVSSFHLLIVRHSERSEESHLSEGIFSAIGDSLALLCGFSE